MKLVCCIFKGAVSKDDFGNMMIEREHTYFLEARWYKKTSTKSEKGDTEPSYLIWHFLSWILLFDGLANAKKQKNQTIK